MGANSGPVWIRSSLLLLSSSSSSTSTDKGNNFITNWFSKRHVTSHLGPRHFLITLDDDERAMSHSEIANKLYDELTKMNNHDSDSRPQFPVPVPFGSLNVNVPFLSIVKCMRDTINNVRRNVERTKEVVMGVMEFIEEIGKEESVMYDASNDDNNDKNTLDEVI